MSSKVEGHSGLVPDTLLGEIFGMIVWLGMCDRQLEGTPPATLKFTGAVEW